MTPLRKLPDFKKLSGYHGFISLFCHFYPDVNQASIGTFRGPSNVYIFSENLASVAVSLVLVTKRPQANAPRWKLYTCLAMGYAAPWVRQRESSLCIERGFERGSMSM